MSSVALSEKELLHQKGLRATPGRTALLETLTKAHAPRTAEELHAKVRGVDLVTVYRNVQSLVAVGLVREVRFKDNVVRYEFALAGAHHHHIVCTACGTIDELPECDVTIIEKQALATSGRFASIDEHALEFFGTCASCVKR